MKKLLYFGIAVLFCLSYQSCKKDDKTPIEGNPYEKFRIKQLNKGGTKVAEFIYDNTNKLTLYKNPAFTVTYEYNASGKISKYTLQIGNVQGVTEFTYDSNGILQSYVIVGSSKATFSYKEGKLTQIVKNNLDPNNSLISTTSYKYFPVSNGEQKISTIEVMAGVATAISTTEIYAADQIDPNPLKLVSGGTPIISPFMIKSSNVEGASSTPNYTITYSTDADGKITSYEQKYPDKPADNAIYTYIYEAKQ
ncbi:MAG: hypothetical protein WBP45_04950 [Daejeonella sp.]